MIQKQNLQKQVAIKDLAATANNKKFDIGFNFGTLFQFIAVKYNKQYNIPQELLNKIKKIVNLKKEN